MNEITIHPAAKMFPEMTASEFDGLKADIREHGLREPVVFWRGQLIDGRHRHRACLELGIEPSECELDEDLDPFAYVVSHNLHRRHLTTSQRSIVAGRLATMRHGGDRKSEEIKPQNCDLNAATIDQAADLLNVSPRSVESARVVLDKGCPELIAAVESGEVPVSKAAKIAASVKSGREQMRMAKEKGWKEPPRNPIPLDTVGQRQAQAMLNLCNILSAQRDTWPDEKLGSMVTILRRFTEEIEPANEKAEPPQREPSTRQAEIDRAKNLAAEFVSLRGELESLNRDSKGVSGNSDVEVLVCLLNRCSAFRAGVADIMERAEHAVGSLLAELVGRP